MVRRTDTGKEEGPGRDLAATVLNVGWEQAVQDMEAMARDREYQGYDTFSIPSWNTAPIAPSQGEDDRFGFSHLVDRRDGQAFSEAYTGGNFTDTGVYQAVDSGNVFMVSEHIDHDSEVVVFIAGVFRVRDAVDLVEAAMNRGKLYTYVRKLDKTILGVFEHDDVSAFFPDPDLYYGW